MLAKLDDKIFTMVGRKNKMLTSNPTQVLILQWENIFIWRNLKYPRSDYFPLGLPKRPSETKIGHTKLQSLHFRAELEYVWPSPGLERGRRSLSPDL